MPVDAARADIGYVLPEEHHLNEYEPARGITCILKHMMLAIDAPSSKFSGCRNTRAHDSLTGDFYRHA